MDQTGQWEEALEDALRGIGGGLVFGVPLLYTMEVWSLGQTAEAGHALIALALTFAAVSLLVASSGFRRRPDLTRLDVIVDVVIAVGLGLFSVAVVLVILQRVTLATPLATAAQVMMFEAAPFAIGAAVATEVFSRTADQPQRQQQERRGRRGRDDEQEGARGTVWDLGATAVGATFIGLPIAPTDEVPMLASGIEEPWLAVLVATSLLVTYAIVFIAGFSDEKRRRQQVGVLQHPAMETAAAYLVSLGVSVSMLWFFGNLDADPFSAWVAHIVVLGFPASIGGAAGRLVV